MREHIFITGSNGWIGKKILEKLLLKQIKITALIRKKNAESFMLEEKHNNLKFIEGDLEKIEKWKHGLNEVDTLIHLAAKVHTYSKSEKEAKDFYAINFESTKKIFEEAEKYGVKKGIFISSVAVNDLTKEKEGKIEYAYASSKLKAERFLIDLNKSSNMSIQIIRPVTLYGGQDKGNFKKLYKLTRFNFFPIIGEGENLKSVIYYEDFAESLVKIMQESVGSTNEVLTIGAETISMNEIAKQFKKSNKRMIIVKLPVAPLMVILKIMNIVNKKFSLKINRQLNTLIQSNTYEYEKNLKYLPNRITLFKNINFKNEYMGKEYKK
ncbi:MAG TPA: hypothetical protein DIS82_06275 [Exiguobacterium sp.]|uniref:NAD-dependent epimerase/dehydratase family protein n=1 Tax=Exiguobacterium sp. TaxID=44751 RepID=UPI000EBAB73C|nr:NAD-dependent epimerase/dehydratase family protein [Exiguobacterium sp.]HCN57748.1 hypothetical protein [Exiguobacterium sp.]